MARVKRGFKARRRRNKVLKMAKGWRSDRRVMFRHAVQTLHRALHYGFVARKRFKREMRSLWIQRISAAAKMYDTSYSKMIHALKLKGIELNRKMLAELAARDIKAFEAVIHAIK
jgi:large subunit ribosomal protein L20